MPDEDGLVDAESIEQLRQGDQRLFVHVSHRAMLRQRVRIAIAVAGVDDCVAVGRVSEAMWKIPPHRERSQAFVEKHKRGPLQEPDFDAFVFDVVRTNGNEGHDLGAS